MKSVKSVYEPKFTLNIYEQLFRSDNVQEFSKTEYLEIFKNPSSKEVNDILKNFKCLRMCINPKGDLYCWRGDILHAKVCKRIPQSKYKLTYDPRLTKEGIMISSDSEPINYNDKVIKICKDAVNKYLPSQIKYMSGLEGDIIELK